MSGDERAMIYYLCLAAAAHEKGQLPGRDRFLVLTCYHACQSAAVEIAEQCRSIIAASSPYHMLAKAKSAVEFARTEEMQTTIRQLHRFCNLERAEHLATAVDSSLDRAELMEWNRDQIDERTAAWISVMQHPDDES